MLTLGIETSSAAGSVALLLDGKLLAERTLNIKWGHSRILVPYIDSLFKDTSSDKKKLGLVAVSIGPGSFTGLRVGLAAAKGIAYASGSGIIAVPTPDIIADNFRHLPGYIAVIIESVADEVYFSLYRSSKKEVKQLDKTRTVKIKSLPRLLKYPAVICGSGVEKHAEFIKRLSAEYRLSAPQNSSFLYRAATAAKLGEERFSAGAKNDLFSIIPFYIKKSIAETEWKKRKRSAEAK